MTRDDIARRCRQICEHMGPGTIERVSERRSKIPRNSHPAAATTITTTTTTTTTKTTTTTTTTFGLARGLFRVHPREGLLRRHRPHFFELRRVWTGNVMTCHVMSGRGTTCQARKGNVMPCQCHVWTGNVMSCQEGECHVNVMSGRVTSCHVWMGNLMSCHVMSERGTSCHAVSCQWTGNGLHYGLDASAYGMGYPRG
jgi:hypothetical protein